MKYVLDSSAFIKRLFEGLPLDAELYTIPEVYNEVRSTMRFMLFDRNLKVQEPSGESVKEVLKAASETGDIWNLSTTDIRLIALAKDLNAVLLTDDFAMQNVAAYLGIEFQGSKRITHLIIRRRKCENGRIVKSPDECIGEARPVVRRKRKIRRVFIDRFRRTNG